MNCKEKCKEENEKKVDFYMHWCQVSKCSQWAFTEHWLYVDEMMNSHLLVILNMSNLVVVVTSWRLRKDDEIKKSFKVRNQRKQLTKIIRFSLYSIYNQASSQLNFSNIQLKTRDVHFRARNRTSLSLHAFWVRVIYLRTTRREQKIRIVTDISF
jgi:hypothetical protein